MQKQKIDTFYLILHSDYESVFCGLFKDRECLGRVQEHKLTASKNLMLRLVELLQTHNVTWSELAFIGVNQGPSPFTTLRVVITTVNGLLFSRKIPLVGIDGLCTFLNSHRSLTTDLTVVLLNAFNKDVYFAIKYKDEPIEVGWEFYATFLDSLARRYTGDSITYIGNAIEMYRESIVTLFPHAQIPTPVPATVSFDEVARQALEQWKRGEYSVDPLLPLYLKTLEYKPST